MCRYPADIHLDSPTLPYLATPDKLIGAKILKVIMSGPKEDLRVVLTNIIAKNNNIAMQDYNSSSFCVYLYICIDALHLLNKSQVGTVSLLWICLSAEPVRWEDVTAPAFRMPEEQTIDGQKLWR